MTEEEVNKLIDERLADLIKRDKYVISKLLVLLDGRNIQLGKTTGTQFGTETTQKIGFHGKDPVAQQAHIANPSGGATVDAAARTTIESILTLLETYGFTATS